MLDAEACNGPKHATAVKYDQRCRLGGPQGTITLCPPSPQPTLIGLFEGWGATFPVNRHTLTDHTHERKPDSDAGCLAAGSVMRVMQTVGAILKWFLWPYKKQGTLIWILIIWLVTQHYQRPAVWSCSAALPLVAGQAMTSHPPNWRNPALPGFWKDGRAATGEILGVRYEVRQFLFTSGAAVPGWVRQEIKWHHESVWLRAQ